MFAEDFDPAGNEPRPTRRPSAGELRERLRRLQHQPRASVGIVRLEAGAGELLSKAIRLQPAGAHAWRMGSGVRARHLPRVKSGNSIGRPFFATD